MNYLSDLIFPFADKQDCGARNLYMYTVDAMPSNFVS